MSIVIAKFYRDFGRSGELMGVCVAHREEIEAAIGKSVYFGEVLGKHSDVQITLEESDFTILTDDKEFITKYILLFGTGHGHNPFDYLEDEDE